MAEINDGSNEAQKEESKQEEVLPVEEEKGQDEDAGASNGAVATATTASRPAAAAPRATVTGMDLLPLDWTRLGVPASEAMPLRYPTDVAEISKEEDLEVVIVGTAGQKITVINKDFSTKDCHPRLKQLILRSHLIRKMQGLENFKHLELLELYDNQVDELEGLDECGHHLRVLDMSYNVIRGMAPVQFCPNLQELYLANNKIKSMEGLKELTKLRKLDLGANRIRIMDTNELSALSNLEELWIGKNKIETIEGLEKLTKLRRLDVQSNRLTKIENLETQLETLEELYLAHNGIDNEGITSSSFPFFPNLSVLDLSRNRLTSIPAEFAKLPCLEELWLSGNTMQTMEDVHAYRDALAQQEQLGGGTGTALETIYLEYNPLASDVEYRKKLTEWFPSLKQIDATMIGGIASSLASANSTTNNATAVEERLRQYQQAAIQRAMQEAKD